MFCELINPLIFILGFHCGSAGKESTCNAGDLGSVPGLERSPGEAKGYPRQYSGLENSMYCIVHGVTKSQTRLSDFHYLPSEPPGKPQRTTNRELGLFLTHNVSGYPSVLSSCFICDLAQITELFRTYLSFF